MVGSGFSLNAVSLRPDIGATPLWSNVTDEIARTLFPSKETRPTSNPLRLAQQYLTVFGRSDLHRLLSDLIKNDDYLPGEIHSRLLELPWRDVFTTNWDTLLERARLNIPEPSYSVVQDTDQLPLMSQPRIIKLHGTLPSQFPLILSEEDYRTYPAKYAPFVNTVQQAMMETIFCLIGFSGDDPNFIEWSGWVRDNLGEAAPKIYLAGLLRLSTHERRTLEERGVVPIDVWNHPNVGLWPQHRRHEYAARWIIRSLEEGKPYDGRIWPSQPESRIWDEDELLKPFVRVPYDIPKPVPPPSMARNQTSYSSEDLEGIRETMEAWAHNRKLYPGWLVFPFGNEHLELSRQTDEWEPHVIGALPSLELTERLLAIREFIWRREILLEPISEQLEDAAQAVLVAIDWNRPFENDDEFTPRSWTEVRDAWRTVALALVTQARLDCNQALFEERIESLTSFANDSADVEHRMQQERCLWALYSSDFPGLIEALNNWNVEKCDPIWALRKAALLVETRRHDEAQALQLTSLNLIRKHLGDDRNISNASRMGWALGAMLTTENESSIFRRWDEFGALKCNVWNEIVHIRRTLEESGDSDEAPSFEYTLGRTTRMNLSSRHYTRMVAAYRGIRLPEIAGLPLHSVPDQTAGVPMSVVSDILSSAANELSKHSPELAIRTLLRTCGYDEDKILNRVLSRAKVAVLSEDAAEDLANSCINLIHFSIPRLYMADEVHFGRDWIARMRVALEVLSRLVSRLSADTVNEALSLALGCYRDGQMDQDARLARPIGNLLRRSWEVLPQENRIERVFELLMAPITRMDGFAAFVYHLDMSSLIQITDLPPRDDTRWDARYIETLSFLISGLQSSDLDSRNQATLRLLPLAESHKLTNAEELEVAGALWQETDPVMLNSPGTGAPADWVFMLLPELEPGQAGQSFRQKWFTLELNDSATDDAHSMELLGQVGAALAGMQFRDIDFPLTNEESELIARAILQLVRRYTGSTGFTISSDQESVVRNLGVIGAEISIPEQLADELFDHTRTLIEREIAPPGTSLHQFLHFHYSFSTAVGYSLIICLVKVLPSRIGTIETWLTTALASTDGIKVRSAMKTVRDWVSISEDMGLPAVPGNVLREIGAIIASRRRDALADALWCSITIFRQGTTEQRDAISLFVQHGLVYLAEEMLYEVPRFDEDVPTIRLLCVQLAVSMATSGYESLAGVQIWLTIGRSDPFPEVRNEVISLDSDDETEENGQDAD